MIVELYYREKVHNSTTIAAIATPLIPSAIGIIRVSGPNTVDIIAQLFKETSVTHRKMVTQKAYDNDQNILDECCYTYYKAPHSYTGEDVLEIFCHGSVYILKQFIQIITSHPDCQLAKNGEFTQRAFLNGKIPLSKAESILDIIESNSEASHNIALNQYTGQVYQTISTCREALMNMLQQVEASLEFPDDVGNIKSHDALTQSSKIIDQLTPVITASDYGALIKKGLTYLIIGEPNVGKSSILNALSGESRSIVSDTAGTTRDYIDLCIEYKGILITLIDTAGIRETESTIEKMGIEKIKELSRSADGYILINDATNQTEFNWPSFLDKNKPIITVINKIDQKKPRPEESMIQTSCQTGEGLRALKNALVSTFIDPSQYDPNHMLCNFRQISALNQAFSLIKSAHNHIQSNTTLDIVCIDLREAIDNLSDIMGDTFTEELLDGIFSKFCIGK